MQSKTFGALIKTQPSLILFVPVNAKGMDKKLLYTVCNIEIYAIYENLSLSSILRSRNLPDSVIPYVDYSIMTDGIIYFMMSVYRLHSRKTE